MLACRRAVLCLILIFLLCAATAHAEPDTPSPTGQQTDESALPTWETLPVQARLKIDPELVRQFPTSAQEAQLQEQSSSPHVTFLVYLAEQADLSDLAERPLAQVQRRELLVDRLRTLAQSSQSGIADFLRSQAARGQVSRYQSYWIFNGLVVEGDWQTLLALAQRPDVASLRPNREHQLSLPEASATIESADPTITWGLNKIDAERVWSELGVTGEGVVVANLDTGVDWTHPALQRKYRGYNAGNPALSTHDYNWFDLTGTYRTQPGPTVPNISLYSDHGTHTMGTMVGSSASGADVVGVAPGAQWIAVKAFSDYGRSTDEWLHAGLQWCLAPTDLDGNNPDPSKAPDIVSNSWGDTPKDTTFAQDIAALRAAGIWVVFAAGNSGPSSGTINSPGSLPGVFSVGATDSGDNIADFSSRGPSPWSEIKPEVAAPGVTVRSTIAGGGYANENGTSMATPHVAGLGALMWSADRALGSALGLAGQSANRTLTITETEFIITSTAVDLGASGEDNTYGYGRIDAYAAVSAVLAGGTVSGTVTDAESGAPLADATVSLYDAATGYQAETTSGSAGAYLLDADVGTYELTAQHFGYQDVIVSGVVVSRATTTVVPASMQRLPGGTVHGRVTHEQGGLPASATLDVPSTPATASVDAQGYYTLTLPAGEYTLRVLPDEPGLRGSVSPTITVGIDSDLEIDFALASAARILLVDADAWLSAGQPQVYRQALDALLYGYAEHDVQNPPTDNPTAAELAAYDIVIWSQASTSPGYIAAWEALGDYLQQGGHLLLSGQNIGYWDVGQALDVEAYHTYLHADFSADDGLQQPLVGVSGDLFEGLLLEYDTEGGDQAIPDAITPTDSLAWPLLEPRAGEVRGLRVDACPDRVVYLSFNLEDMGPSATREALLDRAITWLAEERPAQGVALRASPAAVSAAPDALALYDVWLTNTGQTANAFDLAVETPSWPTRLLDASSGEPITRTAVLAPCESIHLTLEVTVPPWAASVETEATQVQAEAVGAPTISTTSTIETAAVGSWRSLAELPSPRLGQVVAGSDCALYIIGGLASAEAGSALDTVSVLDTSTGSWTTGASKPTPAAYSAIAEQDGRFYVIGGYDPAQTNPYLSNVERYDPALDSWEAGPALPLGLAHATAASLNGHIYVFGSQTDAVSPEPVAYMLDPATNIWSAVTPPPTAELVDGAAAALDGAIYLAGGQPDLALLWRYDPDTDTWAVRAPMHTGRYGFGLVACDGYLYAAGGNEDAFSLSSAERYDPQADVWSLLPAIEEEPRSGVVGALANGRFVVVDSSAQAATVQVLDLDTPLSGSSLGVDSALAQPGDTLHYTIVVRNRSDSAIAANWQYTLPQEIEVVTTTLPGPTVFDAEKAIVTWSGNLAAGELQSFEFDTLVHPDIITDTLVTATLGLSGEACGLRIYQATTLVAVPNLEASYMAVDKSQARIGEVVRYTVWLGNPSPFTIGDAQLSAPLPDEVDYIAGSATGGASYNAETRCIEWQGTLPPAGTEATSWESLTLAGSGSVPELALGHASAASPAWLEISYRVRVGTEITDTQTITHTAWIDDGYGHNIERSATLKALAERLVWLPMIGLRATTLSAAGD